MCQSNASAYRVSTPANTPTEVALANPNRTYVSVTPMTGNIYFVGGDSGVSAANGFPVAQTDHPPFSLTGPAASASIWIIANGGADSVAVFEAIIG